MSKKVLIISYLSKEAEGRVRRHYENFNMNSGLEVTLVQGCSSMAEKSTENNVINIMLKEKSNIKRFWEFYNSAKKYLRIQDFDFYYLHNYYTAIFGCVLPGSKIIYDAYELYYPGCGRKFSMRDYFFYFLERKCIKKAGYLVAANKPRALVMVGKYRLTQIPDTILNMSDANERVIENDVKKQFAIVYTGYLSQERGLLNLIEEVQQYNKIAEKKISLHIYGKGELEQQIRLLCEKDEYLVFCGAYSNADIDSILSKYMFGYVAYSNEELNTMLCSPNKLYDYINNEVVILGNDNYTLTNFVEENQVGCCNADLGVGIRDIVKNYDRYSANIRKCDVGKDSKSGYEKVINHIWGMEINNERACVD